MEIDCYLFYLIHIYAYKSMYMKCVYKTVRYIWLSLLNLPKKMVCRENIRPLLACPWFFVGGPTTLMIEGPP